MVRQCRKAIRKAGKLKVELKHVHLKTTWPYRIHCWIERHIYGRTGIYMFIQATNDGHTIINFCWKGTHDVAWRTLLNKQELGGFITQLHHFYDMANAIENSPAMQTIFTNREI